jgi:hypothetical protein
MNEPYYINSAEISKIAGLSCDKISLIRRYIDHFPQPIQHPPGVKGHGVFSNRNEVLAWLLKHDIKKYATIAVNKQGQIQRDKKKMRRLYSEEQRINGDIKKFLACRYAPWRQFINRFVFSDYLNSEKCRLKRNNQKRLNLI